MFDINFFFGMHEQIQTYDFQMHPMKYPIYFYVQIINTITQLVSIIIFNGLLNANYYFSRKKYDDHNITQVLN